MNDMTEQVQSALEEQRSGGTEVAATLRREIDNESARRADAMARAEAAVHEIIRLEADLSLARQSRAYHERRVDIHTRKLMAARDYLRTLEDEKLGI